MTFTLKGLLPRNFIHPALGKSFMTFGLGVLFLTDIVYPSTFELAQQEQVTWRFLRKVGDNVKIRKTTKIMSINREPQEICQTQQLRSETRGLKN